MDLGLDAVPALEAAATSDSPRLRARARQLLGEIRSRCGLTRLEGLLDRDDVPIEEGLCALDEALGAEPGEAEERSLAQLDAWGERLAAALPAGPPGTSTRALADALRRILGDEVGLQGPDEDYHSIEHVSLARTLSTGRGLPLTLCAIYAAVTRRAGFEAGLLPFPGHVLLGLGPEGERLILDPFVGGDVVSREACLVRLCAMGASTSPRWLTPVPDRTMLVRQVRNYGAALARHGRSGDARAALELVDRTGRPGE